MSMSPGVTPVQGNFANALQIGNASIPKEGPKAIPYNFDFVASGSYLIDINFLYQNKIISVVQVVYCDNSQNTAPTTVLVQQTSQRIIVPPGAEGYFPVLCPSGGTLTISSGGAVSVPFYLINVPMQCEVWYPAGDISTAFKFDGAGNLKTADQLLAPFIDPTYGLKVDVTAGGGGGGTAGIPTACSFRSYGKATASGYNNIGPALTTYVNVLGFTITASPDTQQAVAGDMLLQLYADGYNLAWQGTVYISAAAGTAEGIIPVVSMFAPVVISKTGPGSQQPTLHLPNALVAGGFDVNIYGFLSAS